MSTVTNIDEAYDHFLKSKEPVVCIAGAKERECQSYPDAHAFYSNSTRPPEKERELAWPDGGDW